MMVSLLSAHSMIARTFVACAYRHQGLQTYHEGYTKA